MADLPSYEEATAETDWLGLAASYLPTPSLPACCLVNRRFYSLFAPRLWQDPLSAIRQLGLDPNDDLAWYRRFIHKHVPRTRPETRSLVRSLDFRFFALRASGLYSTEASERAISESFRQLPQLFPNLVCLLIDGHPELDPAHLALQQAHNDTVYPLQLLDLAHCPQELSQKFFRSDYLSSLVYLDVSHVPGSMRSALLSSLNPRCLPQLQVLKARGREMDDDTARLLFQTFSRQLWSLDISQNKLTDAIINDLAAHCFPAMSIRSGAHFEKEGKLTRPKDVGTLSHGPFDFIEESDFSMSNKHPEHYLADAPMYSRHHQDELQEWQAVRSNGLDACRGDDAQSLKDVILRGALAATTGDPRPSKSAARESLPQGGLTHLYLNGNRFTVSGIERLMRISPGTIEHFECDYPLCLRNRPDEDDRNKARTMRGYGYTNSFHLFRPVFSSNLRSLRVHHSFVTRVPTLSVEGASMASSLRLAEAKIYGTVQRAYPRSFVPDTNPRLRKLILTNIPARSSGPIIDQIIRFLRLLAQQQRQVRGAQASLRGRGPSSLSGLQVLGLEVEPDFSEDYSYTASRNDVDFDALLDPTSDDVADDSYWDITSRGNASKNTRKEQVQAQASASFTRNSSTPSSFGSWATGRLKSYPYSENHDEYVTWQPELSDSWTGNIFSVSIWIGSGELGTYSAINEYMWNVQDARLRTRIGPVTPNHVAAGVPPGSYIFLDAWDVMTVPRNIETALKSAAAIAAPLKDVVAAIKQFRLGARGTAEQWDGRIELVRANIATHYESSEYWR
ncbi:uncharacterized protein B0I36DRAFT_3067 [Microdochium trichocladiopsis]|uniref:Leucine rich repeat domain-containing protein n=1 Tax=Microdochium trichocladiopsis TaxID=1682393 RepID=A0A9P8YH39_9PEZI|nr:uncharacterized protein B0I36DRAFT_3067 [Microdochium trichocladiopsis]KAH7039878.1 hypothetical protein B0I36DRAFT_3067 [Microdochium trichocladiopsis]